MRATPALFAVDTIRSVPDDVNSQPLRSVSFVTSGARAVLESASGLRGEVGSIASMKLMRHHPARPLHQQGHRRSGLAPPIIVDHQLQRAQNVVPAVEARGRRPAGAGQRGPRPYRSVIVRCPFLGLGIGCRSPGVRCQQRPHAREHGHRARQSGKEPAHRSARPATRRSPRSSPARIQSPPAHAPTASGAALLSTISVAPGSAWSRRRVDCSGRWRDPLRASSTRRRPAPRPTASERAPAACRRPPRAPSTR